MDIRHFIQERKAVSPVIGVILMVAITVILAAVIGTFVLGLGDQVGDSAPNAQWDAEITDSDETGPTANVTFTHAGGDSVEGETLSTGFSGDGTLDDDTAGDLDTYTAGDTIEANISSSGDIDGELSLYWESGDRSSTLRTFDVFVEDDS